MSDANATTLLVMHARNDIGGQQMSASTVFATGARLRNYAPHGGGFYASVGGDGKLRADGEVNPITVPSGGHFAFCDDVPELPALWQDTATRPTGTKVEGVDTTTPVYVDEVAGEAVPSPARRYNGKNLAAGLGVEGTRRDLFLLPGGKPGAQIGLSPGGRCEGFATFTL